MYDSQEASHDVPGEDAHPDKHSEAVEPSTSSTEPQPGNHEADHHSSEDIAEKVKLFTAADEKKADPQKEIAHGLSLLKTLAVQAEEAGESVSTKSVRLMFLHGAVLKKQKPYVKAIGEKWQPWVKREISFIGLRSAQDYMRLTKIPMGEEWAFLTKNRLLEIAPFVSRPDVKDPIRDLFAQLGMTPEQAKALPKAELLDFWPKVVSAAKGQRERSSVERSSKILEKGLQEMLASGREYRADDYPALESLRKTLNKL